MRRQRPCGFVKTPTHPKPDVTLDVKEVAYASESVVGHLDVLIYGGAGAAEAALGSLPHKLAVLAIPVDHGILVPSHPYDTEDRGRVQGCVNPIYKASFDSAVMFRAADLGAY